MTSDFSWPEQDIIDAWVKKHGLTINRKVLRELKDDVTRYRKSAKYLSEGKTVLTDEETRFGRQLLINIQFRNFKYKKPKLSKLNRVRKRSKWDV